MKATTLILATAICLLSIGSKAQESNHAPQPEDMKDWHECVLTNFVTITNTVTQTNFVTLTNKVDITNTVPRQAIIQAEDLPPVVVEVRTNTVTQWVSIERFGEGTRDIGYLITNRVVELTHLGVTKEFALTLLGREEWPTQKRTNSVSR